MECQLPREESQSLPDERRGVQSIRRLQGHHIATHRHHGHLLQNEHVTLSDRRFRRLIKVSFDVNVRGRVITDYNMIIEPSHRY